MYNLIKNIFNRIKNEIIYGGHIISMDSPAFILTICILQDIPINIFALIIAFFIPLAVYSYNYQKEVDKDATTDPIKSSFLEKRKNIFPYLLSLDIIIIFALAILLFNYGFLIFALIIVTGGILYTTVFKVLTRYVPGFKSIYATLIWAYAGTFFLIFLNSLELSLFYLFIFIFIYLRMFVNIAFFDLKDMDADKKEGLKTLPIILGKNNTIIFLNLINFISIILLYVFIYIGVLPLYAISLSLFYFYTYYYLKKSKTAVGDEILTYSYIIADAEFIFWPIILILSNIIYYNVIV